MADYPAFDSSDSEPANFDLGFLSDDEHTHGSNMISSSDDAMLVAELDRVTYPTTESGGPIQSDVQEKQTPPLTPEKSENIVSEDIKMLTEQTRKNFPQRHPTFIDTSATEKLDFVENMKNRNTVRKTQSVSKIFGGWLASGPRFENRRIHEIPPMELNNYVGSFLLSIRKHDGSDYEPDTLTSYHRGIDRYLRENEYPYSLLLDREFQTCRDVLASKRKELKQKGKGNRQNKSEPLTENEQKMLKEKRVTGVHSPTALRNQMWLNNSMHFGMRPSSENRKLRWGDIALKIDERGVEYLEFNERDTKTRSGANANCHVRPFQPKQFALPGNPLDCPVSVYKAYRDHRPMKMCEADAPFYLSVNHKRNPGSQIWYKCQAAGENTLKYMVKNMANKSNLPGPKTNHSALRSTATRLLDAGVPPTTIMQLTGHKNIASLNNYAVASASMQEKMSNIIACSRPIPSRTPAAAEGRAPSSPSSSPAKENMVDCQTATSSNESPSTISSLARVPLQNTSNTFVAKHSASQTTAGVFHGATFNNCTLNVTLCQQSDMHPISKNITDSQ